MPQLALFSFHGNRVTPQLALLYIVRHRIESTVAGRISNRDSRQLLTDQGNKLELIMIVVVASFSCSLLLLGSRTY